MVRESNPSRERDFGTRPDRSRSPLSRIYDVYLVPFAGVKRPGRGVNDTHLPSTKAKEIVELYIYYPSGLSWSILGWNLPFHTLKHINILISFSSSQSSPVHNSWRAIECTRGGVLRGSNGGNSIHVWSKVKYAELSFKGSSSSVGSKAHNTGTVSDCTA
jgi:hypothetical protein